MATHRYILETLLIITLGFVTQNKPLEASNLSSIKPTVTPQHVAIIGTGYVGLVSGVGLANIGHSVTCVDVDQEKIKRLNQGQIPIYEPNVQELMIKNVEAKRLSFSSDIDQTLRSADIVIIAVGTPMDDNGDANLSALMSVVASISKNLNGYKIICTKSTVPIGTNKKLKALLQQNVTQGATFDVISNPEFLREGSALEDFFFNNPIVLGGDSQAALDVMECLYKPLTDNGTAMIRTDLISAETIKYAWNSYSTIKIAYVNQLSHLCNATGSDIATVVKGMSFSEKLLPIYKVKPGPGFGGSCLPKDTAAIIARSKSLGVDLSIVSAAREANESHKKHILRDFYHLLDGTVANKKIAVLGLSFKANTDDIRYSPAIDFIKTLAADNALIYAYDPQAMNNMSKLFPDIHYCANADEALSGADAVLLLTEWNEFRRLSLEHIASLVTHRVVLDARNIWNPRELKRLNFNFVNLGYQGA